MILIQVVYLTDEMILNNKRHGFKPNPEGGQWISSFIFKFQFSFFLIYKSFHLREIYIIIIIIIPSFNFITRWWATNSECLGTTDWVASKFKENLSASWTFLKWQTCHFPLMVFCLFRTICLGFHQCSLRIMLVVLSSISIRSYSTPTNTTKELQR